MKLVIAEKPSVAQELGEVIGATKREDGYLSGDQYIVSWCYGHLVELAPCETYDDKYKKWKIADLPILPNTFVLQASEGKSKQINVLKKLMFRNDVDEIIVATDAGREGELIFRHVYNYVQCKKPFKRLWISSYETESIQEGFKNLIEGHRFDHLYHCAYARQQADWLIGMNVTRLFTCKYNEKLTLGRVQTPTLAMICKRDEEIANFKTSWSYKTHIMKDGIDAESEELENKEAEQLAKQLQGKNAILEELSITEEAKQPPKLFDLTLLQREANKRYGYTAKETLEVAQKLYEGKFITYPRTDSNYLTEASREAVHTLINKFLLSLDKLKGLDYLSKMDRLIDDKKVSDHHAIIPTKNATGNSVQELGDKEQNILNLIIYRMIIASGDKAVYKKASGKFLCEGYTFSSNTKYLLQKGYIEAEERLFGIEKEQEDKKNRNLFELKEKDTLYQVDSDVSEHEKKAKAHYTDATLLKEMERAGIKEMKEIEDIERTGLGTPATRASIIENLIQVGYVSRKGKSLLASDKGVKLIAVAPKELTDVELTVEWEKTIANIKLGKDSMFSFINDIKDFSSKIIDEYKVSNNDKDKVEFNEKKIVGKCPKCKHGNIIEKNSSKEKYWICDNEKGTCNFRLFEYMKYFDQQLHITENKLSLLLNMKHVTFKIKSKSGDKYDAKFQLGITDQWINLNKVK